MRAQSSACATESRSSDSSDSKLHQDRIGDVLVANTLKSTRQLNVKIPLNRVKRRVELDIFNVGRLVVHVERHLLNSLTIGYSPVGISCR